MDIAAVPRIFDGLTVNFQNTGVDPVHRGFVCNGLLPGADDAVEPCGYFLQAAVLRTPGLTVTVAQGVHDGGRGQPLFIQHLQLIQSQRQMLQRSGSAFQSDRRGVEVAHQLQRVTPDGKRELQHGGLAAAGRIPEVEIDDSVLKRTQHGGNKGACHHCSRHRRLPQCLCRFQPHSEITTRRQCREYLLTIVTVKDDLAVCDIGVELFPNPSDTAHAADKRDDAAVLGFIIGEVAHHALGVIGGNKQTAVGKLYKRGFVKQVRSGCAERFPLAVSHERDFHHFHTAVDVFKPGGNDHRLMAKTGLDGVTIKE